MMTRILSSALILLLFFCACKKENYKDMDDDFIILDEFFFDSCYNYTAYNNADEVKIISQDLYEHFADSVMKNPYTTGCTIEQLPAIDFNTYFLIGKQSYISGSNPTHELLYDMDNKKILYKITTEINPILSSRYYIMNWTLLPKKYINYKISYDLEYKNVY